MKIRTITVKRETADQLQPIGSRVLLEVFPEAEIAGGVEEKSERVAWGGINPDKPDNVRVRELGTHPHLTEVPLELNVSHAMCEGCSFLTRKIRSTSLDS